MQILGVSGSLRGASTNTRLLLAATRLVPPDVEMRLTALVGQLPWFNPDREPSDLGVVDQWIREVRSADGLVVSTPEYAGGYPGALKNALDWLVGTDSFINKPFMLLNASSRSVLAQHTLLTVLTTMSGVHVERATITIPLLGTKLTASEILDHQDSAEKIRQSLLVFVNDLRNRGTGIPA